ncbi:MAG TPA: preprotein translocase subunit SecE [Planctomycetota bacterium]|nr:preprotein translocase subunit SecE [Planctomycetota bacterium]
MKAAEGEEDFEREAPRIEPAAPTAVSDARFRAIALASALITAFCAGASVYFLFTPRVAGVALPVNAWMGVGAGLFLALAWLVVTKLSARLGYAKGGQGRWARVGAYVGFGLIALYGAIALHKLPGLESRWFAGEFGLWQKKFLGALFTVRPVLFPAIGFFLASMIGFHLFVNRPRAAEFLIETQGELKRVSWPTRREWIGSTVVVLALVTVLSLFLFGADSVLSPILQKLRIGF